MTILPRSRDADIALLLEGTYPYVSGGVSSWVHQMLNGLPDLRFALIFVGSRPQDYGDMRYRLPPNVCHLETHYLHQREEKPHVRPMDGNADVFGEVARLHDAFREPAGCPMSGRLYEQITSLLDRPDGIDESRFLYSREAWKFLSSQYRRHSTDPSFVDYFWTIRAMHEPIWLLDRISRQVPRAKLYHSISTGYAGLLGALIRKRQDRPLVLTEHGIYTKERKIDLFQNQWIRDNRDVFQKSQTDIAYFRKVWIRFFDALGRVCYSACDAITTLYETNRMRQISDGAPENITRVIPNGIDLRRFAPLRAKRPATPPPVLCLIGRVVPIKDVKTFLRAMRTVVNGMPEAEGWIAGPEDEDKDYAAECHNLAQSLGLSDHIRFLGFQQVESLMPRIGLVILSSISEAQPLVVLEGFAAGVPAITTDVGSCRQLIQGLGAEDEALGSGGDVVNIADPEALGRAALALLTDTARYQAAQATAIARVERGYTQEQMFANYSRLYEQVLHAQDVHDQTGSPSVRATGT